MKKNNNGIKHKIQRAATLAWPTSRKNERILKDRKYKIEKNNTSAWPVFQVKNKKNSCFEKKQWHDILSNLNTEKEQT